MKPYLTQTSTELRLALRQGEQAVDLVVRAMADARNTASHRVLEKLGMSSEGVLRQNRVIRGEPIEVQFDPPRATPWHDDDS